MWWWVIFGVFALTAALVGAGWLWRWKQDVDADRALHRRWLSELSVNTRLGEALDPLPGEVDDGPVILPYRRHEARKEA